MMNKSFKPGQVWLDIDGKPIQAHGGGIFYEAGVYYWFGENKDGETYEGAWHRVDVIGISCYSSTDLLNWKDEGVVLPSDPNNLKSDLHPSKTLERPKVLRSPKSGKYVLFTHVDHQDYSYARIGIAISDTPTGPYKYLGSIQPNGSDSRDMTAFQDDDGKAYLYFSSEWNKTMQIVQFDDEYLHPTDITTRAFINQSREAPAVFKHNKKYYILSSGCTGWDPNSAELAVANTPLGPWEVIGDPCVGPDAAITFHAQSTFVLPVAGVQGAFIAMFDRWNKYDLRDSRYVWLPVKFDGGVPKIYWYDKWDLSNFEVN
ncbi:glycoside hydrolase family 43 protein [Chloroflexota bacterium]